MDPRAVLIPPFSRVAGEDAIVAVRATLVDASTRQPVIGYTDDGARFGESIIYTTGSEQQWLLLPNAAFPFATMYRITVESKRAQLEPPVDCALLEGAEPIPLWQLLGVGAPDEPADFWGALILTSAERAALNAANAPSGDNAIATMADLADAGVGPGMQPAMYDPLSIRADAFDLSNHHGPLDGGTFF